MFVKGTVKNGVITVLAGVDNRVVGYKKPVSSSTVVEKVGKEDMKVDNYIPSFMVNRKKPLVKPVAPVQPVVDVPSFMKEYSEQRRKLREEEEREEQRRRTPRRTYSNLFNRLHDIRE